MKRLCNVQCVKCKVMAAALVFFVLHITPYILHNAFAQSISSADLINNAKEYDGKTVSYAGEVIGDVMARGDYAWININDGKNAIGIWMGRGPAKEVTYTGSYKTKGDWVEVTGIFHRSCSEHGGDLDIHAQGIRKVQPGRQLNVRLNEGKKSFALVLLGVLALVWILRRLKIK